MRVEFDLTADAMYTHLVAGDVADSDEVHDGVVLDYDVAGKVSASSCST